ncbi:conserved hypothetical protein [Dyadobacter sp. SG02]|uniref:mucoidy inhibitor MuiA family protein n=1 Tax=Dyadobacter sp. SG02 TaxID=1855291 RepID=UPI0008AD718C|nr:mucoidy inhibitor MuiA family protein [Dyadobacter sp. SG02]SEJ50280.1 conserved hypothetical protein [Dyadobacter sp. SG02]
MRLLFLSTLISAFFVSLGQVNAQKTQIVNSTIKQVTIYRNGAEVTRDISVSLDEGTHELIFKGLSASLDKESIRLSGLADLTVLSVLPKMNYNQEGEKSKTMRQLEAKSTTIKEKIAFERGMEQIYKQEEEMLIKNQQLGGDKVAVKTLELKEAIDFQRKRLIEVLQKKLETSDNIKKWEDSIKVVGKELSPLITDSQKATMEIIVTVSSKKAAQVKLELSYYVADAGWYPSYDAKLTDLSAPLSLQFKAGMYQYSGEDWKKVKLILSSANPKDKSLMPELRTWYWGLPNDYSQYRAATKDDLPGDNSITEVSGFVKDGQDEPLPGVSVTIKAKNVGAVSDANGFYQLSVPANLPAAQRVLDFSFIGFKTQSKPISDRRIDAIMQEDVNALEEVVVVGYGGSKRNARDGRAASASVVKKESIGLNINEREAPTSVTYEIPVAYTLLSDGKTYIADLKTEQITDSYYEYLAIPKVRQGVFLNAYLPSWANLNLLPGDVNLYLENSYVGKTHLDPANAPDTLSLSFGVDKSVSVRREQVKSYTKKQFLGNNVTENRTYRIALRNAKTIPVKVVVRDQYPLARSKEVEVFDKSAPDAKLDENTGKLTWAFSLPAGESKELSLRYAVKYPKSGYATRE